MKNVLIALALAVPAVVSANPRAKNQSAGVQGSSTVGNAIRTEVAAPVAKNTGYEARISGYNAFENVQNTYRSSAEAKNNLALNIVLLGEVINAETPELMSPKMKNYRHIPVVQTEAQVAVR